MINSKLFDVSVINHSINQDFYNYFLLYVFLFFFVELEAYWGTYVVGQKRAIFAHF